MGRFNVRRFLPGKRIHLRSSIKESLDNLPMGLCFYDRNGRILLANHRMITLVFALTGRDLQNGDVLWHKLQEGRLQDGVQRLSYGQNPVIALADGSVWSFSWIPLSKDQDPIVQIMATNITDLHETRQELSSIRRHLEDMQQRLEQYGASIMQVTAMEERLHTKVRIHQDMGRILLATRRALVLEDEEEMIRQLPLWKTTIELMKNMALVRPDNSMDVLQRAAASLGVRLEIQGELPQKEPARSLLLQGISEGLNNAVRHGDATWMGIAMESFGDRIVVRVQNNGRTPEKDIQEGGGLSQLRLRLEEAGGSLQIAARPVFLLEMRLPLRRFSNPLNGDC